MADIVTRAGKGSELTHDEMDANFNEITILKENGSPTGVAQHNALKVLLAYSSAQFIGFTFTVTQAMVDLGNFELGTLLFRGHPDSGKGHTYSYQNDRIGMFTMSVYAKESGGIGISYTNVLDGNLYDITVSNQDVALNVGDTGTLEISVTNLFVGSPLEFEWLVHPTALPLITDFNAPATQIDTDLGGK